MATYAVSDIHGCYMQFQHLLDVMSPAADDELYILGDVVDRGPKSPEMLKWCIDAPPNVHVLLGNHEDMLGCSVARDPARLPLGYDMAWSWNGGEETRGQLLRRTSPDWRAEVLGPWLRQLKPYARVKVAGRRVMLVHAGFDPRQWDPDAYGCGKRADDEFSHGARVDVGWGFGEQNEQTMVWARDGWYDDPEPAPEETIFGHTATTNLPYLAERSRHLSELVADARPGRIWHCLNRHCIDCGCVGGGKLAGLRLDDMEEFYVRGRIA